jgi:RimJ/RimL family protein N-acetyltransferase
VHYPIVTERLILAPLTLADLHTFVSYRRDPAIARFQGWETTYSDDDARTLIDSQAGVSIPKKGQWLQLAIHHQTTGEHVGDLALHSVVGDDAVYEIGFTIAKIHQRQGFAREAASSLMEILSTDVGATKIVANTDRRNTASVKLLEALGFVREPSRSWTEKFKTEVITVDYFETQ